MLEALANHVGWLKLQIIRRSDFFVGHQPDMYQQAGSPLVQSNRRITPSQRTSGNAIDSRPVQVFSAAVLKLAIPSMIRV